MSSVYFTKHVLKHGTMDIFIYSGHMEDLTKTFASMTFLSSCTQLERGVALAFLNK